MLRLSTLFFIVLLAACAVSNAIKPNSPLVITKLPKASSGIWLDSQSLLNLKVVTISNWPMALPKCEECEVVYQSHFLPQGPEKLIKQIDQRGKLKTLVIDAKRKIKRIGDWTFELLDNSTLNACNKTVCESLNLNQSKSIADCNVNIPWLSQSLSKVGIADSAKYHFQVIIMCP